MKAKGSSIWKQSLVCFSSARDTVVSVVKLRTGDSSLSLNEWSTLHILTHMQNCSVALPSKGLLTGDLLFSCQVPGHENLSLKVEKRMQTASKN